MLEAMRKGSKNIFVKGFMAILALSFVIWGVGDVFRGRTGNAVATIGGMEISYEEYSNTLRREIARYQQILGKALTEEQIEQYHVKNTVLNQLVDSKIITKRINELNIKVGDSAAKEKILSNNMFMDESGKFSKQIFDSLLKANGINQNEYIESLKREAAIGLFIDTMAVRPAALESQAKTLYDYRNKKAVADVIIVPKGYVTSVGEPSETDLVQYYNENSQKFSIPESRDFTYLTFGINDVKAAIKISDEELQADYDANKANYQTLEQRDVDQYLFDSEPDAKNAKAEIVAGKAKSYAKFKADLGKVTQDGLPEEVKTPIFSLKKGEVSEPVKSPLGWHVFVVKDVIAEQQQLFKDVKEAIRKNLAELKATESFYETSTHLEDELASGIALEEVAKKFNLVTHKVTGVDKAGNNSAGKQDTTIPDPQTVMPMVFSTESGAVSSLTLLPDNSAYVVARVDSVSPERVKALDEVKGSAIDLWKEAQKGKNLEKSAKDIAKELKDGGDVDAISKKLKLKVEADKEIGRTSQETADGKGENVPSLLAEELFATKIGGVTDAYKDMNGNFVIAKLTKIKDSQSQKEKLSAVRDDLSGDFTDDILMQYNMFLRKEYPVVVNETLLHTAN